MARIITDSSADLLSMKGYDFVSVPMMISTAERSFEDDPSLDTEELLEYLEKFQGRSYTACPGTQAWLDAYEGAKRIYVVTLTGHLSGAYNSACLAAEMYLEENPEAEIHVFDSRTTGPHLRLIVEKIAELDRQGMPFDEVVGNIEDYIQTTRLFFSFQSLRNFAQNGRVNKVLAAAVSTLGIRIVGTSTPDGDIDPVAKCRGDQKAMDKILSLIEEAGWVGGRVRILHIDNPELAEKYRKELKKRHPETEIEVYEARGLCSYYGERGGVIFGVETNRHVESAAQTSAEEAAAS